MNGGQDLGGMQGFGPVVEEADEPQFHAHWEARAMAMVVALGAAGKWNIDQSRHARESLPPADYLRFPYYRIWVEGVCKLMLERGMVMPAELENGTMLEEPLEIARILRAEDVEAVLIAGGPADRPSTSQPKLAVGDVTTTINAHPSGHTRLPRYARGRSGTVSAILGHHVFPDKAAKGEADVAHWLYQVRFSARELWGAQADPRDGVTLDLWEPYLVAA
ncbi:MAG: nitrile hydratase subunit beta [Ahrensia sp.]|nr:nitrile hydratase subunit beta [Ahrensia sp.]